MKKDLQIYLYFVILTIGCLLMENRLTEDEKRMDKLNIPTNVTNTIELVITNTNPMIKETNVIHFHDYWKQVLPSMEDSQ